jgi:hypothetical protein
MSGNQRTFPPHNTRREWILRDCVIAIATDYEKITSLRFETQSFLPTVDLFGFPPLLK